MEVEKTISAATVTWEERDSSATSSAGRFLEDFLPLVLIVRTALVPEGYEQIKEGKTGEDQKVGERR